MELLLGGDKAGPAWAESGYHTNPNQTDPMDSSTAQSIFASITDRDAVNQRGRALGAAQRSRTVQSYDLVLALLRTTGTGAERTIAAVRRGWEMLTGKTIAPSSFDERFNPGLIRLLWELFEGVTRPVPRRLRRRWPRAMQSLRDIILCDGTRMALDAALATTFRGTGEGQAGLKLMAVLSLDQGQLTDVRAGAAVHHDRKLLRLGALVADALYLMDLGFYDHSLFAELDDADAHFISRLKEGVVPLIESIEAGVVDARHAVGKRLDGELRYHRTVDVDARLRTPNGPEKYRVFRVVKVEVPRADRHDQWQGDHHQFWFVTNLPRDVWTTQMIAVLYRLRWSIERAFRSMKTLARLDQIRSERPTVIFAFVVASLIVWALGAAIVREMERDRGIGRISHDRVQACLVEGMADLTMTLCRRSDDWERMLRERIAILEREGRHPNPSQPRRITTVFEKVKSEARILAQAA